MDKPTHFQKERENDFSWKKIGRKKRCFLEKKKTEAKKRRTTSQRPTDRAFEAAAQSWNGARPSLNGHLEKEEIALRSLVCCWILLFLFGFMFGSYRCWRLVFFCVFPFFRFLGGGCHGFFVFCFWMQFHFLLCGVLLVSFIVLRWFFVVFS